MTTEADWFERWVKHHATVFGMDRAEDLATFLSWRKLFLRVGYTEAELREATDWLALNDPPTWRVEHLKAIQARIRSRRIELREQKPADGSGESYPDCHICHGAAWVIVPDLRAVSGGEWNGKHTCAVLCSCPYGHKESLRHKKFVPVRLSSYERRNPGWADQVERHRVESAAVAKESEAAQAVTAAADKRRGPIHLSVAIRERLKAFKGRADRN